MRQLPIDQANDAHLTRDKEEGTTVATLRDALRAWADGIYPTEAGVELLIRQGKAIQEDAPWIIETHTDAPARRRMAAIDSAKLLNASRAWSGGEQRVTRIAASLIDGQPINLNDDLPGLDRDNLALVLAAIAHAGGSHEHSRTTFDNDGVPMGFESLPSLYPWPAPGPQTATTARDR